MGSYYAGMAAAVNTSLHLAEIWRILMRMAVKAAFSGLGFFAAAVPDDMKAALKTAAAVAVRDVIRLRRGEQTLIIANPHGEAAPIAMAIYDAALDAGGRPVLIFQDEKKQLDFAEPALIAAFAAKPEVVISISSGKLGKDEKGIVKGYMSSHGGRGGWDGAAVMRYDHVFHFLLHGKKSCRAFWSPGITIESFCRTVPIDYAALRSVCGAIQNLLTRAEKVVVTAPGGTNIVVGLHGRTAKSDDGDFSAKGSGGNLPAGEAYISPQNGTTEGTIVFDGSMTLNSGDILIQEPIVCTVKGGFVNSIDGGVEARLLWDTIAEAERNSLLLEKQGRLGAGNGPIYARNARNIGELGIGLNEAARITGNMLEDEKAIHTCHFAIGHNYDEDAPALIHLDGLVRNPTIIAQMPDGTHIVIEQHGELQ